jgi:OOP family OmpA-OmpF porin
MKIKLLLTLLLVSSLSSAQYRFNQFSIEAGAGYVLAGNPYSEAYDSDFSGFRHVNLGVRYMINENYGVRLTYANDRFLQSNGSKVGITYNRIGVDGIYNLGRLIDLAYASNENIGLLGHVGVGYTKASPLSGEQAERIGTVSIGFTPQFKLGENTVFYTDFSANANIKQHLRFDGGRTYSGELKSSIGSHYNISFGLMIYLGQNRYHADWY